MLKVESLHADIGGSRILRGVSLEVGPGEVACLMGRNGVGKTTTLKSITGLRDVRFVDCVLTDANFAMAHGEKVRFEGCRMQRCDFRGAQLEAVAWWDCDLTDAEFSQVKVARAQLHGSVVDGLRGATNLTPISIDRHQFAAFAEHLLHSMGVSVAGRTDD